MKKFVLIAVIALVSFSASALEMAYQNPVEMKNDYTFTSADIVQHSFDKSQYVHEDTAKSQACLHHTASGIGVKGDIGHWLRTPERIVTPLIIDREGITHQLHSTTKWGFHLGISQRVFRKLGIRYQRLDKLCVGLELDSWGGLKLIDGEFRAYPNDYGRGHRKHKGKPVKVVVSKDSVIHYKDGHHGYEYFEKYTDKQIHETMHVLHYLNKKYNIPVKYSPKVWSLWEDALKGKPGVYTHVSYRPEGEKSDCHPQPELIKAWKDLAKFLG